VSTFLLALENTVEQLRHRQQCYGIGGVNYLGALVGLMNSNRFWLV